MPETARDARGTRRRPERLRQPRVRRDRARGGVVLIAASRVLGVDPGSYRTGWGVVTGDPARPVLLDCGVILLSAQSGFPERLHLLQQEFAALVSRVRPTAAAVEAPFHGSNARSALQLAHARGVILAVLAGAGVSVREYAPATVKKAVTGSGVARKEQVEAMVERLLRFRGNGAETQDTWDALAAALCHLATLGHEAALGAGPRTGA